MIVTFKNLTEHDQAKVGRKAYNLALLFQKGLPVPNGFIILPSAFSNGSLQDESWQRIQSHLEQYRNSSPSSAFAIRSSASIEDAPTASFAGEFETILNQQTDQEIKSAIQTVYASKDNERSMSYREEMGIHAPLEMAVIVQEMIPAHLSGVLFTADPIKSDRMRMVGNFVEGLGEALVSGQQSGHQFVFHQPKGAYEGPAELNPYSKRLYSLATQCQNEFGNLQDIEWAILDDNVYILQSRPITTMEKFNPITGEWNDSLTGTFLWTGANAGEAFPEVLTPLSWTISKIFLDAASPPLFTDVPAFGNIAGRVYLNTANIPILGLRLGFKRRSVIKLVEGVAGKIPDEISIPDIPLRLWPLIKDAVSGLIPFIKNIQRARKEIQPFLENAESEMNDWIEQIANASTPQALASVWEAHQTYIEKIGPMMLAVGGTEMLGMPEKMIESLTELVGHEEAALLMSGFSPAEAPLESAGPIIGIAQLNRGEIDKETYIRLYGHRGPNEADPAQPRPGEDLGWLDQRIQAFSDEAIEAEKRLNASREAHQAARARFIKQYPSKSKRILKKIDKYADTLHLRERVRNNISRSGWVWRLWALKAGKFLDLGDNVFYLTLDELLRCLNGETVPEVEFIPNRIKSYDTYRSYSRYPSLIQGRFEPHLWVNQPNRSYDVYAPELTFTKSESKDVLKGSAGSLGIVEGKVRLLDSIEAGHLLEKGEILVAVAMDIGWTPIFPRAAAIVTDIGASLSHASIVARELGIPAVFGCGDATQRLKTGDRIRVNGGQGTVEILSGLDALD